MTNTVEEISDFDEYFDIAVEEAKKDFNEVDDISEIEPKYYEYDVDLDDRDDSEDRCSDSMEDFSMDGFDLVEDIQAQLDSEILNAA